MLFSINAGQVKQRGMLEEKVPALKIWELEYLEHLGKTWAFKGYWWFLMEISSCASRVSVGNWFDEIQITLEISCFGC